jgi:hypothetical protein
MGAFVYGTGFQTLVIVTFFLNGIGICTINIKILGGNLQSIITGSRTIFEWYESKEFFIIVFSFLLFMVGCNKDFSKINFLGSVYVVFMVAFMIVFTVYAVDKLSNEGFTPSME